jgi:hypothetical protein
VGIVAGPIVVVLPVMILQQLQMVQIFLKIDTRALNRNTE